MAQKVLVAMSGGVDSSVAAFLLKEQGYEVVGAHMKLWDYVEVGADIYNDGRCCTIDSITDCRMVCDAIDAPFYVLNMSRHFRDTVIEDFITEYDRGRTPNPCIQCNSNVKWTEFLKKAEELGCDYIATGHYSFIEQGENSRYYIRKGVDGTRDQSYVLWGVSQQALSKTLMPLGGMLKSEVREVARKYKLRTAEKAESREICFVVDNDYRRFLVEMAEKNEKSYESGDIIHTDGTVLGQHKGTAFYTIGQRKGLGISHPTPLYVQKLDVDNNKVIVGDNDTLFRSELEADSLNWIAIDQPNEPFEADVKIRYLHEPSRAIVTPIYDDNSNVGRNPRGSDSNMPGSNSNVGRNPRGSDSDVQGRRPRLPEESPSKVHIKFIDSQRAITPGQSVVFYNGDILLGGGLIIE
ncbi:MAG: tRNA 2-thiouridine(34) synthase MnmA [Calditrichaeota bacterium]|nr:MAG: tRNA 2-thiouridine(34) synthase MnmA [Calditrichota bacterium]